MIAFVILHVGNQPVSLTGYGFVLLCVTWLVILASGD